MEMKKDLTSNTETVSRAEYEELQANHELLQAKYTQLKEQYDSLLEELVLARKNRFGSKAEPASEEVLEQLSLLFDEPEATIWVEQQKVEQEEKEIAGYVRKARNSGSVMDIVPDNVEIEETHHRLEGEDLKCPICGTEMVEIGVEERRTLEIIPEQVIVHVDIYHNYACRECEKESDQANIVKTPKEPAVIPGSFASAEAIAYLDVQKYVMGAPLYRQEQHLKLLNVQLSRQTMSNWMVKSAELWLKPIFCLLHEQLVLCKYLHADETVLQVLHEPGKTPQSKSYMWLYRTGSYAEHPVVLYEYQPGRGSKYPLNFLSGFTGYLQTDGYVGYDALKEVTHIGCMAHLKRKFHDAVTALPNGKKAGSAVEGEAYCEKLFQLERTFENLSPEQRRQKRQELAKPILDAFLAWASTRNASAKSKLGEALTYLHNNGKELSEYLNDSRLEISNNLAERSIKPFVIDRKNFLFANTPKGATSSRSVVLEHQTVRYPFPGISVPLGKTNLMSSALSDSPQPERSAVWEALLYSSTQS